MYMWWSPGACIQVQKEDNTGIKIQETSSLIQLEAIYLRTGMQKQAGRGQKPEKKVPNSHTQAKTMEHIHNSTTHKHWKIQSGTNPAFVLK